MNPSLNTVARKLVSFSSIALFSAFALGGCIAGDQGAEDFADDIDENVAEGSEAVTVAATIWETGNFASTTIAQEQGRYKRESTLINGKNCWSHEKGFYSIGYLNAWYLFRNAKCVGSNALSAFPASTGKPGVDPCVEGISGITCTQPKVGSLVPLYSYPKTYANSGVTSALWTQVLQAKQANPTVPLRVIINPCNGPKLDDPTNNCTSWGANFSDYTTEIAKLKNAGITVLGYVATGYATRSTASVKADIDLYNSSYAGVEGIFFDEMTNDAVQSHYDYYRGLNDYAKSKNAYCTTVGNPGADTQEPYVYTVDTLVTYESNGLPSLSALQGASGWHTRWDRANFAIIPYGILAVDATFLATARPYSGFTFLTNDDLPNPWDTVPSYFSTLLGALN